MTRSGSVGILLLLVLAAVSVPGSARAETEDFDHGYQAYAEVLGRYVVGTRVDYAALRDDRAALDGVVDAFGQVSSSELEEWPAEQQIAYWVNAYNAFTLQAVIDHYPIDGGWFSFVRWAPRNSIKQIAGVWTDLRWAAGGLEVTLDEIEHETLRVKYQEPRIHFAINCAALSCPPLRREPYVAARLDLQLMLAARDFLASPQGSQVDGDTLWVSSIFSWFGDDFIDDYAHLVDADASDRDRATLGVVAKYGPAPASSVAQSGRARLHFLKYDWGLNDTAAP